MLSKLDLSGFVLLYRNLQMRLESRPDQLADRVKSSHTNLATGSLVYGEWGGVRADDGLFPGVFPRATAQHGSFPDDPRPPSLHMCVLAGAHSVHEPATVSRCRASLGLVPGVRLDWCGTQLVS